MATRERLSEQGMESPARGRGQDSLPDIDELVAAQRLLLHRLEATLETDGDAASHELLAQAADLHRRSREVLENSLLNRLLARERAIASVLRLMDLASVQEILDRGPEEAARIADLDRVVLSSVRHGELHAEQLYVRDGVDDDAAGLFAALQELPTPIVYPMPEAEAVRRPNAYVLSGASNDEPASGCAFDEVLSWRGVVIVPIVLQRRVIALFHGDRCAGRPPLTAVERETLWTFARGYALIFERAVLRRRLQHQQHELNHIAAIVETKAAELEAECSGTFSMGCEGDEVAPSSAPQEIVLAGVLTRRELEVLEMIARGETNPEIARELVLSTGTVKFHVSNILRKLHAVNRADAAARFLRLSMRQPSRGIAPDEH